MIVILTPVGQNKAYSWNQYVRGVRQLDLPKKEIFWLFVVVQQGLADLSGQLQALHEAVGNEYAGMEAVYYTVPVSDQYFDPRYSGNVSWKERAEVAAMLRAVGFDFVKEALPEATHVLSLGSDVLLNRPHDLTALLDLDVPLATGVLVARTQGFPLVLRYEPEQFKAGAAMPFSRYTDYPRNTPFQCDWAGMDVLLVSKDVYTGVNLWEYDLAHYGLGEDGWYCMRSEELTGTKLWFDPKVAPYHVHQGDIVWWAGGDPPRFGVIPICPYCQTRHEVLPNTYTDTTLVCWGCRRHFVVQRWDAEDEIVVGVKSNLIAWG